MFKIIWKDNGLDLINELTGLVDTFDTKHQAFKVIESMGHIGETFLEVVEY